MNIEDGPTCLRKRGQTGFALIPLHPCPSFPNLFKVRFRLIFLQFAIIWAIFIWTKFVIVGKAFHRFP